MAEQTDELGDLEGDIDMEEIQAFLGEDTKNVPTESGRKKNSITKTGSDMSDIATVLETSSNEEKSTKKNVGSTKLAAAKRVSESVKNTPSNVKTKPAQGKEAKSAIGTTEEDSDIASMLSLSDEAPSNEKVAAKKTPVVVKKVSESVKKTSAIPSESTSREETQMMETSSVDLGEVKSSNADVSEKMESTKKLSKPSSDVAEAKVKSKDSSVGDIAGVLGSFESQSPVKASTTGPAKSPAASKTSTSTASTKPVAKKPETGKQNESVESKMETEGQKVSAANKKSLQVMGITEKESLDIDRKLSRQMFNAIKNCPIPPSGERYLVFFSPLELADLAVPSVQKLILTHPHIAFCFNKQVSKFKKKKGYGQVLVNHTHDMRRIFKDIFVTDLVEKEIEIRIEGNFSKQRSFTGTFKFNKDKSTPLNLLLVTGQTMNKASAKQKYYLSVDNMPGVATFAQCKALFPFSSFVVFDEKPQKKEGDEPSYQSVKIYYNEERWMKGVTDCCSDFTFNDEPLNVKSVSLDEKEKQKKSETTKPKAESEKEKKSEAGQEKGEKKKNVLESPAPSVSTETETSREETDMVSSLTRDLCSDVMESLNKLRQLESDNPNVQRILEMHAELAKLQESLSKDSTNSDLLEEGDSSELAKDEDSADNASAIKGLTDDEMLETLFEQEAETEQRQAEKLQKLRQEQKEEVEKRKSTWAKKLLAESKDLSSSKQAVTKSVKEMAQKLLKANDEKSMSEADKQKAKQEEEERKKIEAQRLEQEKQRKEKEEEERKKKAAEDEKVKKEEEEKQRKEKELKAQQQLREELERAENAQKQASASSSGGFDPKAMMMRMQKSFQSLSQTLPKDSSRRLSQDQKDSARASSGKRDLDQAELGDNEESKRQKLQEEPPVLMPEREYKAKYGILPADHRPKNIQAQVAYQKGRMCPLETCRTNKSFMTEASFAEHWRTFHTQTITVKFCTKCTAYFSKEADLRNHLQIMHNITGQPSIDKMVAQARTKVVNNPSYQDSWPFTYTVL